MHKNALLIQTSQLAPPADWARQPLAVQPISVISDYKAIFQPDPDAAQPPHVELGVFGQIHSRLNTEDMARLHLSGTLRTLVDVRRLVSVKPDPVA